MPVIGYDKAGNMGGYERRRHQRVKAVNLLTYACFDDSGRKVEQGMGRTLNVSESGILLETHVPLDSAHRVAVTIALDEDLISIEGSVVRSIEGPDGMYESGLQFSGITDAETIVLNEYIKIFLSEYGPA